MPNDNIQLKGKSVVHPIRLLENASTENATFLSLVTDTSRTVSASLGSEQTKDGPIVTDGSVEQTISFTAYCRVGDTRVKDFENACIEGKMVEVWEADLERPVSTASTNKKYAGRYWRGKIASYDYSFPADGMVEITMEVTLEGTGYDGDVTVEKEALAELYSFRDTPKVTNG